MKKRPALSPPVGGSKGPALSERSESKGLAPSKSRGFTLIELLVVIAIMAFLVVAAISSLSRSRTSREVKTSAENLRNFLTEARSLAMNPESTSFGTEKIIIQINKNGDLISLSEKKTERTATPLSQNFKPPSKVKIIPPTNSNPTNGNMKCEPICGNPSFYYFSFLAKEDQDRGIGQITDSKNKNKPILINVEDSSGTIKFQLTINHLTGNIGIEKIS